MKKWAGVLLALLACFTSKAQTIYDIDMTVRLQPNGDALVTQVWDTRVYQGTEWYVPIGSTKGFGMTLTDFSVSENGKTYASDGRRWDTKRSREQKAFRSGIVDYEDGSLELCWGVGSDGDHTWTLTYTLKGLVQSFDTCDGWGFQFLGDELPEPPEHVKITILPDFETEEWVPGENVGAWTFGFHDDIWFEDNSVIAESTEAFSSKSRIAVMMRFDKGMFSPEVENSMKWEKFQKAAFKGSDYKVGKGIGNAVAWMFDDIDGVGGVVLATIVVVFWLIGSWFRKQYIKLTGKRYKKSVFGIQKIDGWWRDIPMGGSIPAVYSILKSGDKLAENYDNGLIGAYFLRWIQDGIVKVLPDPANEKRVNLIFDKGAQTFEDTLEQQIYDMALSAAGENNILEKGEFERWSKLNYEKVVALPSQAKMIGKNVWQMQSYEERQHVVMMKNFLQDYTMMEERGAGEVRLWKYYLVYAQLFGIAEQVAKNFEKLYPAKFEEYTAGMGLGQGINYYTLLRVSNAYSRSSMATALAKASAVRAEQQRSSGGGGRGSFGGGHSFGGGGSHGGGTR